MVHQHDLNQARESIRENKAKGDAMKKKSSEIKKLTAMYNFKNIGCRIGKDSLELKQLISKEKEEREQKKKLEKERKEAERKRRIEMSSFNRSKKEKNKFDTRKRKYDEIISLNIPDDKLSNKQLTDLINFKKSKDDSFNTARMKKAQLKTLWIQLKDRPNPTFQSTNDMNGIDMPTANTTLPEHQQILLGEAEISLPTLV